jgi:oligopeptide/dipeptide ABC transporter ATP-binding protein
MPGLEEQVTPIISRRDISDAKKAQRVRELKHETGRSSFAFLQRVSAQGNVPFAYRTLSRIPLVRGRFLGLLEREATAVSAELLSLVGMPNITAVIRQYPYELSGGMRQRAMIAMAIAASPELIIADEPTSALDVTIQAQILELLGELKRTLNTAVLFISHDMGVIAETCDKVGILYAGNLVEMAKIDDLFADPLHPYTKGLLSAIPPSDRKIQNLGLIPGSVPNLIDPPPGCRFNTRCPHAFGRCKEAPPPIEVKGGHYVRCWLYAD